MVGTSEVKFLKHSLDGQKFIFSGSLEEFDLICPEDLKAIDVDDICLIEISAGITPDQIASKLKFIGNESADFNDDALDEYDNFDWGEYQILPGLIQRQVIVTELESQAKYLIVGIDFENEIELFARIPPYLSISLIDSFGEENLLAYNQWYSEGPGPISWEGEFAIFLIRKFLLFTTQGDAESDTYIIKIASEEELPEIIFDWLVEHGQLVYFIFGNVAPNWNDTRILKSLGRSLEKLTSYNSLELNVTTEQIQNLLCLIRESNESDSRVLEILETPDHPRAGFLTQYLNDLSDKGAEANLISWGDFLSNVAE
jgi:hypothetical protein